MKDKGLYLTADASVEVPDLDRALIKKSRAVNFTKEEYEKVKEVLSKELELEWGEGKTDRRYLQYEGGVWDYVDVTDADNAEIIKKAEGGSENSAYDEVTNVSGPARTEAVTSSATGRAQGYHTAHNADLAVKTNRGWTLHRQNGSHP